MIKENFPNLIKETDMQVKESQRVPDKMDAKKATPRHIIIKMPKVKDKERILKQQEKRSYHILLCIMCTLLLEFLR